MDLYIHVHVYLEGRKKENSTDREREREREREIIAERMVHSRGGQPVSMCHRQHTSPCLKLDAVDCLRSILAFVETVFLVSDIVRITLYCSFSI